MKNRVWIVVLAVAVFVAAFLAWLNQRKQFVLPDISAVLQNKSDIFLVKTNEIGKSVIGVTPMPGSKSGCYHGGGHVEFNETTELQAINVYAPLDGIVSHVDKCFAHLGYNDNPQEHYKIHIQYAQRNNKMFELQLAFEPMAKIICSSGDNPDYFSPYIKVQKGQKVSKGQIIGQMVLIPGSRSHIHFNSLYSAYLNTFMCPDIFAPIVVNELDDTFVGDCQNQPFTTISKGSLCYNPGPLESHSEYQ